MRDRSIISRSEEFHFSDSLESLLSRRDLTHVGSAFIFDFGVFMICSSFPMFNLTSCWLNLFFATSGKNPKLRKTHFKPIQ